MIKYNFSINEEIARWVVEIYIKNNPHLGWWIAFTNPTAGPWKKINVPDKNGENVEVYRFLREEERPDLILVNDKKKAILLVEAKDNYLKIVAPTQMKKSVRVIENISKMLKERCPNPSWEHRKKYEIVSSFLWFCGNVNELAENEKVQESFDRYKQNNMRAELLNIIVKRTDEGDLINKFTYKGKSSDDLDFDF